TRGYGSRRLGVETVEAFLTAMTPEQALAWAAACKVQETFCYLLSGFSNKFLYIVVVSLQFMSSVILWEGPVHRFAVAMACVSPSQDFPTEGVERWDTSVKTRRRKRRELDLGPMKP